MNQFPVFNYKRFSELPLDILDGQKFPVYILGFSWDYLFVNDYACKNLEIEGKDLLGRNMWQVFPGYLHDPNFLLMKRNAENRVAANIVTVSPVSKQRISISNYTLEDCYFFSVSILPNKESLLDELRGELGKQRASK